MNCWDSRKKEQLWYHNFLFVPVAQRCPPDAKGASDSGLERYNRPLLSGKCVAGFSDLSMLKSLVNLLSFFAHTKAGWSWLGNCALLWEVQLEQKEPKDSTAVKKWHKTLMVFSFVVFMCLFLFYSPVSSVVHFVLHGLKCILELEQWHQLQHARGTPFFWPSWDSAMLVNCH